MLYYVTLRYFKLTGGSLSFKKHGSGIVGKVASQLSFSNGNNFFKVAMFDNDTANDRFTDQEIGHFIFKLVKTDETALQVLDRARINTVAINQIFQ